MNNNKRNYKKYLYILIFSLFLLPSCTHYVERQSQALSAATYATNDSIKAGRFELATTYSDQTLKLVVPPKKRIEIKPLYQTQTSKSGDKQAKIDNVKYIVIPEYLKGDKVLVVNSNEYNDLQKDSKLAKQLKVDNANLVSQAKKVEKEQSVQEEIHSKLIRDYNTQQTQLVKKDLAILRLTILSVILAVLWLATLYLLVRPPAMPFV